MHISLHLTTSNNWHLRKYTNFTLGVVVIAVFTPCLLFGLLGTTRLLFPAGKHFSWTRNVFPFGCFITLNVSRLVSKEPGTALVTSRMEEGRALWTGLAFTIWVPDFIDNGVSWLDNIVRGIDCPGFTGLWTMGRGVDWLTVNVRGTVWGVNGCLLPVLRVDWLFWARRTGDWLAVGDTV